MAEHLVEMIQYLVGLEARGPRDAITRSEWYLGGGREIHSGKTTAITCHGILGRLKYYEWEMIPISECGMGHKEYEGSYIRW